jgi:hypothetical protein
VSKKLSHEKNPFFIQSTLDKKWAKSKLTCSLAQFNVSRMIKSLIRSDCVKHITITDCLTVCMSNFANYF